MSLGMNFEVSKPHTRPSLSPQAWQKSVKELWRVGGISTLRLRLSRSQGWGWRFWGPWCFGGQTAELPADRSIYEETGLESFWEKRPESSNLHLWEGLLV